MLLVYAAVFVITPFEPSFPGPGRDPSWMTALNEAVVRHLVFGRDVVFTYGPYGSANTGEYHPSLPWLAVGGGLVLAAGYVAAVLVLLVDRHWTIAVGLSIVLVTGIASFDSLSMAYPLVAVLVVHRLATRLATRGADAVRPWGDRVLLVVAAAPLGLLPLVKLSSAPAVVAGLLAASALLAMRRCWTQMVLVWAAAAITALGLWLLAGQPVTAIADYALTALPTITGFSQSMSLSGNNGQLVLFLAAATFAVVVLALCTSLPPTERAVITLMVVATLFVALKAGFVRHDAHVLLVAFPLIVAGLAAASFARGRGLPVAVLVASLLVAVPMYAYNYAGPHGIAENARHALVAGPVGLFERLADDRQLVRRYDRARAEIRDEDLVPTVRPGTDVDLYPSELAGLFVQHVRWNPRPVFQSYVAYTPELIELNADHLRGSGAPQEVLFTIDTIDERLPALEDGASWLPLLQRYEGTDYDAVHDYLRMRRRSTELPIETGDPTRVRGTLGDQLDLPSGRGWLASFDVRPSTRGRLRNLLWKTPSMTITLVLEDGSRRHFRFVPEMARSEFLLSPFVQTAQNFAGLVEPHGTEGASTPPAVRAIRVDAQGSADLWERDYSVELRSVDLPARAARP